MPHPNQFKVNEAWIAFRLNDEPIHITQDGNFHFFALMDAASCFILGSVTVSAKQAEPTPSESKQLLEGGKIHSQCWPKTLFVSKEQHAEFLVAEAENFGIEVIRVAEEQLLPIIGEVQEGFRERFGSRGSQ
jgi:hypothetical protein